jgi:diacylglycerol kinase (ATP)
LPAIQIIANPTAGGGSARKVIPQLTKLVQKYQLDAVIHITTESGHAIDLARQAAEQGCSLIVAAGGDGTVNEVVNGLLLARSVDWNPNQSANTSAYPALGVISIGRGNDFAQGAGVPADLEEAVRTLAEGKRRVIDIGLVKGGIVPSGRYFCNCVGIGFDAMTTIQVKRMPRLGGFLSFFLAVLKTFLVYYKGPKVQLDFNGQQITLDALLVSIMNGQRLGGGFWLAPQGLPDDYVFDVCIAQQVGRLEIMRLLPMFLKGTQEKHPAIHNVQTTQIRIKALQGVLPAHMDGEIISETDRLLEIQLLPHQLDVIIPVESHAA